jgi:hypothetical protein
MALYSSRRYSSRRGPRWALPVECVSGRLGGRVRAGENEAFLNSLPATCSQVGESGSSRRSASVALLCLGRWRGPYRIFRPMVFGISAT